MSDAMTDTRSNDDPPPITIAKPAKAAKKPAAAPAAPVAAPAEAPQPEPKRTLLQRLNAAQLEVDYVQKEWRQGMRYSIVSHDAVTAKVRPVLVKHGVLYYPLFLDAKQHGNRTEAHMMVRFVSIDDSEDYIDVPSFGYGIDDQDKGPGKAMSYAVKYALLKALGMETGDDPDLDQDVKRDEREPGRPTGTATNGSEPPSGAKQRAEIEAADKAQGEKDAAFIDGLILRVEAAKSKEALLKLHEDTSEARLVIKARSPELQQRYLDAMKARAADLEQKQAA